MNKPAYTLHVHFRGTTERYNVRSVRAGMAEGEKFKSRHPWEMTIRNRYTSDGSDHLRDGYAFGRVEATWSPTNQTRDGWVTDANAPIQLAKENPMLKVHVVDDHSGKVIKCIPTTKAGLQKTRAVANVWAQQRANRTGRGAFVLTPKLNPLSIQNKVVLGLATAGALAAIYYVYKGSSSASSTPTSSFVLQPGSQAVTVPLSGFTMSLPAGATWLTVGQVGVSTPFTVPPMPAGETGYSVTYPISWKDANGNTQTTNLNVTVA